MIRAVTLMNFCRDVEWTGKLVYSSVAALLGYSVIVAVVRAFSVRTESGRVMVAAPIIAFVVTHILYLNLYQFDLSKSVFAYYMFIYAQIIDAFLDSLCEKL